MQITWKFKAFNELTIDELYAMMVIRQEVFILEQDCPYMDADGKDQKSHHLLGYDTDDLVAHLRLVAPKVSYKEMSFGRIVTSKKVRGKGVGKQLMQEGIRQGELLYGKQPNRISAQSYLIPFYSTFGFRTVGEEYLEDDIPHTEMLRL
ncbi:MAG: GNAT family N-acetyltransferase [Rhodobacteraceae bacterium]|nr:GNAT family N-acetyltransferase [Paracoccaceae bacterium]